MWRLFLWLCVLANAQDECTSSNFIRYTVYCNKDLYDVLCTAFITTSVGNDVILSEFSINHSHFSEVATLRLESPSATNTFNATLSLVFSTDEIVNGMLVSMATVPIMFEAPAFIGASHYTNNTFVTFQPISSINNQYKQGTSWLPAADKYKTFLCNSIYITNISGLSISAPAEARQNLLLLSLEVNNAYTPLASSTISFPGQYCSHIKLDTRVLAISGIYQYEVTVSASTPGTFIQFNIHKPPPPNDGGSGNNEFILVDGNYTIVSEETIVGVHAHVRGSFFYSFTSPTLYHDNSWIDLDSIATSGFLTNLVDLVNASSIDLESPGNNYQPCLGRVLNDSLWNDQPIILPPIFSFDPFHIVKMDSPSAAEKTCQDIGAELFCFSQYLLDGILTATQQTILSNLLTLLPIKYDEQNPCYNSRQIDILQPLLAQNKSEDRRRSSNQYESILTASPYDMTIHTASAVLPFNTSDTRTMLHYAICIITSQQIDDILASGDTSIISASTIHHPSIPHSNPIFSGTFTSTTTVANESITFTLPIPYTAGPCSDLFLYKDSYEFPGVFKLYDSCTLSNTTTCYSFVSNHPSACMLSVSVRDNGKGDTDIRPGIVSDAFSVVTESSSSSATATIIILSVILAVVIIVAVVVFVFLARMTKSFPYNIIPA